MRKSIRRLLTVAMTAVLATGGLCYTADQTKTIEAAETYQLVWSDEFNGTSLDTNTWSYDIGNGDWGWGNGEVQYYTNRTKNVEVADGYLQIHALKESYGGKSYTSGRILSKGKKYFKYGKIEAKIKVENGNQSGVWPAYWMMGENMADGVGWPYCGEIDIMEHANSNNYVGGCLHWNTNGLNGDYSHGSYGSGFEGAENSYGYFTDNTNNGINGWHTYTLIWDENHMEWQLDGKTYLTQEITDNNAYCFQKEQFFLFIFAFGVTVTVFKN
jgi:beta-glucanase (GH16 family)